MEGKDILCGANVSSVPNRSPFRYPGGKTWLIPQLRKWLVHCRKKLKTEGLADNTTLVEPFAGGATASLTGVFEDLVHYAILIERDRRVRDVWRAILRRSGYKLAQQVLDFSFSQERVMEALSTDGTNVRERAFRTLLENRVSRNGILSSTGGYLKNGEEGRGLKSRWYPETISKRIKDIADRRDRITLHENVDGRRFLRKAQDKRNYVYFIDPPYSEVGRRLYEWSTVRPHTVFDRASQLKGRFLMTYKNVPQIRLLAERFDFETAPIRMWNGHNARRTELLISNDLSWLY